MKFFASLVSLLVLCSACNKPQVHPVSSRETIVSASDRFWAALHHGDADTASAMSSEDVVVMSPGADEIRGRENLKNAIVQTMSMMKITDFTIVNREIDVYDSSAYELTTYTETLHMADKPPQNVRGRYLLVWKRDNTGSWSVHRNLYNFY